MRVSHIQSNFTGGEITPRLAGHVDAKRRRNACKALVNLIPGIHGEVTRRGGSRFAGAAKHPDKAARILTYSWSVEQSYTLEIGDGYVRFWSGDGQIVDDGANPVEVAAPYQEDEIPEIQFAADQDVTYLCHRKRKTQKLSRLAHDNWTMTNYAPTGDPFTAVGDWPGAVTFYKQRLLFGGTDNQPNGVWAARSADPNDFTMGTEDDDAFHFVLLGNNHIQWLADGKKLLIGTQGNEYTATGENGPITPTDVDVDKETGRGSIRRQPAMTGEAAVFIQRAARKIRGFFYAFERDGHASPDLSLWCEHLLAPGIEGIAFQKEPTPILWMHTAAGQLIGITYEPEQDLLAAHRHELGRTAAGEAFVESITVTPTPEAERLWLLVRRTVGGNTVRYLEYVDPPRHTTAPDACFVDCGLTYEGADVDTLTGLEHLEGEEVLILAGGFVLRGRTVTGGQVALGDTYPAPIHVGLAYTHTLTTLPPETGTTNGTAQGRQKAWAKVNLRVLSSARSGTVNGQPLMDMAADAYMDTPEALFTGDVAIGVSGWDRDGEITVESDAPLPFTLLCIHGDLNVANT